MTKNVQLLEAVAGFNDCADAEVLVAALMKSGFISEELVASINEKIDTKKSCQVSFTLLKITEAYCVYINEDGGLSWCDVTSKDALSSVLDELKHYNDDNAVLAMRAYVLRGALLAAGRVVLKSYDVFTTFSTSTQSKDLKIKDLIYQEKMWTAKRVELHKSILESLIGNVRYLSEQISGNEKMEKGLFCVRGSVASGKSTFVKAFLKQKLVDVSEFNGVINTDSIKRLLVKEAARDCGVELPGYIFHDEASMISVKLLSQAKEENLLYFIDKRMQEDKDLGEIISDAHQRNLPLTIFDVQTDFITSALRVLGRTGRYPSDPTPDFNGLFKSFKATEEGRDKFLRASLDSAEVKNYYTVRMTSIEYPTVKALKEGYEIKEDEVDYSPSKVIKKEKFSDVLLASGKGLKEALDQHSLAAYKSKISKNVYRSSLFENIKNTSRTYGGDLDVSASIDKKEKINTELSEEEVRSIVQLNINNAYEFVYDNKYLIFNKAGDLKSFINEVALILNHDLLSDESQLIRTGKNSHKYYYVDTCDISVFYDSFVGELLQRLNSIESGSIETAAWIEWNVDFSGHIFSDGCGRIAKLISAWWLMRKNSPLPDYAKGSVGFDTIRESYRKRFTIREEIAYSLPTKDRNYNNFLKYYKRLFQALDDQEKILAAGGLIYNSSNQFLILQSTKGKDVGNWVVPGGKLEKGEVPEEAFKREVFEETGLELEETSLLGIRDYTAASGNRYQFYDYTAVMGNDAKVVVDDESSSYKWISENQISLYKFGDSIRNFLNKYFTEDMVNYYQEIETVDIEELDVPTFSQHTMSHSLADYVRGKLPAKELERHFSQIQAFEVHGIYPDKKIISNLDLEFEILEVIYESMPKPDNSNSLRPLFLLAKKGDKKIIVCCVTPGRDLLLHYASMIRFLVQKTEIKLSVFAYPIAEETIDKWTGLDSSTVQADDVVILGYSTHFKKMFIEDPDFSILTVHQNRFYTSTRFLSSIGKVVNCLEANYGHWGNISDYLARRICQLGASEILHIGKVGTFTSPSEIYKRIYIPNKFVIGRRREVLHSQARIANSMEHIKEYLSLGHVSVSTTMEETFMQREVFHRHKIETIDIESSKIAQAIALYNLTSDRKVKFGAIHFASDYLRRYDEMSDDFEFDLSTKRIAKLFGKKDDMLIDIFAVIKRHLSRSEKDSLASYVRPKVK